MFVRRNVCVCVVGWSEASSGGGPDTCREVVIIIRLAAAPHSQPALLKVVFAELLLHSPVKAGGLR